MGALQIDRSKGWEDCANACLTQNGVKRTRRRMWILGWPVSLCDPCVKRMVEAYDGALSRIFEESP